MTRPAIQLYTLRELDDSVPDLIRRVGETPLEGVEFAGLGDSSPTAIADALDETGLNAVAAHVGVDTLQNSLAATADAYAELGCDTLIVPMVAAERFASAASVGEFADELDALAARLSDHDIRLGYHNHSFEFEPLADGRLAFDHLVAETSDAVRIEFDVGLATWAGTDPVPLLERYGERVDLVHLTDSVPGEEPHHRHYGTGQVDLNACATAARACSAEWCIYEHGRPDDPETALAEAAAELPALLEHADG